MTKKVLLLMLLFSFIFISCDDDDDQNNNYECNSNFSITIKSIDNYKGDIGIYFFKADEYRYKTEQDISQIVQYTATNEYGEEIHSYSSYINNGNTICCDIEKGEYFICVVLYDTQKHAFSYIEKKDGDTLNITKTFESMYPENSHEEW